MAVSASTVWNVQVDGTSTHGGGFVTGASGTDYSKTIAVNLPANNTVTGATSVGAGNTVLTAQASADWVGNIVNVTAGTNFTSTAGSSRFECLSVVAGVSATFSTNAAGASICTGVGVGGAFKVGGALAFYGSSTEDALLENSVAGNTWYIKSGNHAGGSVNSLSAGGTSSVLLSFIGYTSTQGDTCNGSNRPVITQTNSWAYAGGHTYHANIVFSGSGTSTATFNGSGGNHRIHNCKFINTSTTANQTACSITQHGYLVTNCEFVSIRGYGFATTTLGHILGCWFNNSVIGYRNTSSASLSAVTESLFSGCITAAIQVTSGTTFAGMYINNTIYGYASSTPVGIGIDLPTGSLQARILNSIFYGLATGINHATASQITNTENFNTFFGNTTNRTNFATGTYSIALDPQFKNVVQRSGTTATTTAGNHLVQAGATFQTWAITPGTHYLYVVSGTGVTTGIYQIASVDSETQISTVETLTANATGDKTWYITTGLDFRVGTNMQAAAVSGLQSSYLDLGAVQRLEDYPIENDVRDTVVFGNDDYEGNVVLPAEVDVRNLTNFDISSQGTMIAAEDLWEVDASTLTTVGSIGKQLADNVDDQVSKGLTTTKFIGLK